MNDFLQIGDFFIDGKARKYKILRFSKQAKKYPVIALCLLTKKEKRFSEHFATMMRVHK